MLSNSHSATLEKATTTYESQLNAEPTALAGYFDKRAITDVAVKEFRLGYVADPLPGDERFTGRLAIPFLYEAGVRAIKYRCVLPHSCKEYQKTVDQYHFKYAQPDGQEQRIYNAAAYFSGGNTIGVCEGEIDAISATIHLGLPTMGIPGAQQWQKNGKYWELSFRDFSLVIVFADGDKPRCTCHPRHDEGKCPNPKRAGLELGKQIAQSAGNRARLVHLPQGEDVNSMVVAGRAAELRKKAGL